ncbi:HAD-like domain-containing protein [Lipomyces starkeyi]
MYLTVRFWRPQRHVRRWILCARRVMLSLTSCRLDFVRRRMSVVLSTGSKTEMICKGVVEELLDICSSVREYTSNGTDVIMFSTYREQLLATAAGSITGLRVLAVAAKVVPDDELEGKDFSAEKDEHELTFLGFLTFLDPPMDDCADVIEDFKKYHVGIKVLTGDNLAVACNVRKGVGILNTGRELDNIVEDDEKFHEAVERCSVFAKLTPIQKFNIVNALKKNGHTVGFLGDGINDALALRSPWRGLRNVRRHGNRSRERRRRLLPRQSFVAARRMPTRSSISRWPPPQTSATVSRSSLLLLGCLSSP